MILRFGSLFLLAQIASAQVVTTVTCEGGSATAGLDYKSAPSGPVPPSGIRVTAFESGSWYTALANLQLSALAAGATATVDASANATMSVGTISASSGVTLLLTFSSAQPTAGSVTIGASGTQAGIVPSAAYSVDLGADGSYEFTSPTGWLGQVQGFTIPVVLGAVPLKVRLNLWSSVSVPLPVSSASAYVQVVATFASSPASWFAVEGAPCGAALASQVVRTASTEFRFQAAGAPVTPHGFFVFGATPLQVVVPPTNCKLLTDILIPVQIPVLADGSAALKFAIPNTVTGTVRAQFLAGTIDAQNVERWWTSNLIQIVVP